jgi:hypothetical protein
MPGDELPPDRNRKGGTKKVGRQTVRQDAMSSTRKGKKVSNTR